MMPKHIPKVILQIWEEVKILNFEVRAPSDVYGPYMYALETWYILYGHGRCLLVADEYMAMADVF